MLNIKYKMYLDLVMQISRVAHSCSSSIKTFRESHGIRKTILAVSMDHQKNVVIELNFLLLLSEVKIT